jgi:hypothetical protein
MSAVARLGRSLAAAAMLFAVLPVAGARADVPWPPNPQPCSAPNTPADCIPATDFYRYNRTPSGGAVVRPDDFNDVHFSSERSDRPEIRDNPQELLGVKGVSLDLAYQTTTGRPEVILASYDSGYQFQSDFDVTGKLWLNRGELPLPRDAAGVTKPQGAGSAATADPYDLDGNGIFTVRDYCPTNSFPCDDHRVTDRNGNGTVDGEDVIFAFTNGTDADGNGYRDDITGWDFFEDDNDPLDEVSYGHGTFEADTSGAEVDNGMDSASGCPNCLVMPNRVADGFIADVNDFAEGVVYAVDHGAAVLSSALGTVNSNSFTQDAIDYAWERGVILIASAADEEAQHHNQPSELDRAFTVNATCPAEDQEPPSWLYLGGGTNFGTYVNMAGPDCSSSGAVAHTAGPTGLAYSAALDAIDRGELEWYPGYADGVEGQPLSAAEVRGLLQNTADDIDFATAKPPFGPPMNYVTTLGTRFPSTPGWDPYFGFGRLNADRLVDEVAAGRIPPEVDIESPNRYVTLDPADGTAAIRGRVAALRADSYTYKVEVALTEHPRPGDYITVKESGPLTAPRSGRLATLDVAQLAEDMPDRSHPAGPTRKGQIRRDDYNRYSITVRVTATDSEDLSASDQRNLFVQHDDQLLSGWPRDIDTQAGTPMPGDLNNDGVNELVLTDSNGFVHAYRADGSELRGWPVHSTSLRVHRSAGFTSGALSPKRYEAFLGGAAVADLNRDGNVEVVAADMSGRLYVWNRKGHVRPGFPVRTKPAYSTQQRRDRDYSTVKGRSPDFRASRLDEDNRLHWAIFNSPSVANLDGSKNGSLEILAGAMDRHVYAWKANGRRVPGWPVLVADPEKTESVARRTHRLVRDESALMGTKINTTPSIGDIDGDGDLEVVVTPNEEYEEPANFGGSGLGTLCEGAAQAGALCNGNARLHVLNHDGRRHDGGKPHGPLDANAFADGFPKKIGLVSPETLTWVANGFSGPAALANVDGVKGAEIGVFGHVGVSYILKGDGSSLYGKDGAGNDIVLQPDSKGPASDITDMPVISALGYGTFAEMSGKGTGWSYAAPTAGIGRLVDIILQADQSAAADDSITSWDVKTNTVDPGFPHQMNDLQFLAGPAAADLTGDGMPELIQGSSVHDVHAVDEMGEEAPGWPKNTGNWVVLTPAVGDITGDGKLEVISPTREGPIWIWETEGDACGYTPWPVGHHDPWHTGDASRDAVRPARVRGVQRDGRVLSWKAGTDDGPCGKARKYEVLVSRKRITDNTVASARVLKTVRRRGAWLPKGFDRYVAVRAVDDAGNVGPAARVGQVVRPRVVDLRSGSAQVVDSSVAGVSGDQQPSLPATGGSGVSLLLGPLALAAAFRLRRRLLPVAG